MIWIFVGIFALALLAPLTPLVITAFAIADSEFRAGGHPAEHASALPAGHSGGADVVGWEG